ncbi:hypothetical protein [Novosphingobium sp.]|uniref:hypothetical protein n=1 Tax=Novosphingobium sp. TaxID=1874826 RepID=UPI0028B1A37F|nr:hypothetical protein [Novosphingobium sp.]
MADDWQVGDLALCVSNGPDPKHWMSKDGGPTIGSVHTVISIDQAVWLHFSEFPKSGFFCLGFRKIRPLTDEEREAFEADLRVPGHDLPTHTPQAPAREVVALPARSETHTPLQGRAGSFDFAAHTQPNAL